MSQREVEWHRDEYVRGREDREMGSYMHMRRNTDSLRGRGKDFSTERVTLSSGQGRVSLGWSHNWVQQCATRRGFCPLKLPGHARCLGPAWVPTERGRECPRPLLG